MDEVYMVTYRLCGAFGLRLKNTFKPFDTICFAIVPHRKNYFNSVWSVSIIVLRSKGFGLRINRLLSKMSDWIW
jgi:hypothetical protein